MKKPLFTVATVKTARKKFAKEKAYDKTIRIKASELESLLLGRIQ